MLFWNRLHRSEENRKHETSRETAAGIRNRTEEIQRSATVNRAVTARQTDGQSEYYDLRISVENLLG